MDGLTVQYAGLNNENRKTGMNIRHFLSQSAQTRIGLNTVVSSRMKVQYGIVTDVPAITNSSRESSALYQTNPTSQLGLMVSSFLHVIRSRELTTVYGDPVSISRRPTKI